MTQDEDRSAAMDEATNAYGLRALATVVFDIDSGQRLDALYPPTCKLGDDAKKSIAHLALPHSNNQDEGDTQFTVRFREASDKYDVDMCLLHSAAIVCRYCGGLLYAVVWLIETHSCTALCSSGSSVTRAGAAGTSRRRS